MNTYPLKISSPDGDLFNENVAAFFVRGADGDLAVLSGHIPFITTVKECECKIEFDSGDIKKAKIGGGLLTVSDDGVTLLLSELKWV